MYFASICNFYIPNIGIWGDSLIIREVKTSLFFYAKKVNIWKSDQDRKVLFLYAKLKNRGT